MEPKQLLLWDEKYLDKLNLLPKRSLTSRVSLGYKFDRLRKPLDFNEMVNLIKDKYSNFKVSKALLISLSEYFNKKTEDLDFVDLVQMYYSIGSSLDGEINRLTIKKWKKANNLSFFGQEQYRLMENYFNKKMSG